MNPYESLAKARAVQAEMRKPKGPMTLFRTEKHSAEIRKEEALLVAPRFGIFKRPRGKMKERLETMYHRYHRTFQEAKTFLFIEWGIEIKKARARLEFLEAQYARIEKLEEKDL